MFFFLRSREGFVWYELLLVIVLISIFATLIVPRFLEVKEKENVIKVRQALEIMHRRQKSYLEESGRYGLYDDLRIGDLGFVTRSFEFSVEHVTDSTYTAIGKEKKEPYRFMSIDQDSNWAGDLIEEE
ncbi:MAG: type II secretion system protein [Gemmatimonadota bacterium]|nr:MAG: type II secretion system protein [Gemmatimonadota bacterium]